MFRNTTRRGSGDIRVRSPRVVLHTHVLIISVCITPADPGVDPRGIQGSRAHSTRLHTCLCPSCSYPNNTCMRHWSRGIWKACLARSFCAAGGGENDPQQVEATPSGAVMQETPTRGDTVSNLTFQCLQKRKFSLQRSAGALNPGSALHISRHVKPAKREALIRAWCRKPETRGENKNTCKHSARGIPEANGKYHTHTHTHTHTEERTS